MLISLCGRLLWNYIYSPVASAKSRVVLSTLAELWGLGICTLATAVSQIKRSSVICIAPRTYNGLICCASLRGFWINVLWRSSFWPSAITTSATISSGTWVPLDVGNILCMSDFILNVEGRRGRFVGETVWWMGFGHDGRNLGYISGGWAEEEWKCLRSSVIDKWRNVFHIDEHPSLCQK